MEMGTGFLVNNQSIRARFLKGLKVALGLNYHQVHIEEGFRACLERLDNVRSKRNGWNECPVHNIHVKPISTRRDDIIHLLPKTRDIRGEN
jgi:hypothetical protein